MKVTVTLKRALELNEGLKLLPKMLPAAIAAPIGWLKNATQSCDKDFEEEKLKLFKEFGKEVKNEAGEIINYNVTENVVEAVNALFLVEVELYIPMMKLSSFKGEIDSDFFKLLGNAIEDDTENAVDNKLIMEQKPKFTFAYKKKETIELAELVPNEN